MKHIITIIVTILATASFYEFKTEGVIKNDIINPIHSETFHSYLNTNTGEVTHHNGYLPNIEWRESDYGLMFAYQKDTDNMLVGLNGRNIGDQWFWGYIRNSRGGRHLIPEGYTMVDLRENQIPRNIWELAEAHCKRNEEIVFKAIAKDEFVVKTPPVSLPRINW